MKKIIGIVLLAYCLLLLFNCAFAPSQKEDLDSNSIQELDEDISKVNGNLVITKRTDITTSIFKKLRDKYLESYKKQSDYTDPGAYKNLYKKLPNNPYKIIIVIEKQLMHAFSEWPFASRRPDWSEEDGHDYPNVESMLEELVEKDEDGLTLDREPEDRLVCTCRSYSILLASILRYKGIPARVRYGFADIHPLNDKMYSHVICEMWDSGNKEWIVLDANKTSREEMQKSGKPFEYAGDVWIAYRDDGLDISDYGIDNPAFWGDYPVLDGLCHDMESAALGRELMFTENPPLTVKGKIDWGGINDFRTRIGTVYKIAEYMQIPELYYVNIENLYDKYSFLQY